MQRSRAWAASADTHDLHTLIAELGLAQYFTALDLETFLHCRRTQQLAIELANRLALSSREVQIISLGAFFHDIGKSVIAPAVLNKSESLLPEEWQEIQRHPLYGYDILQDRDLDERIKRIVLEHHRWYNGIGGYPQIEIPPRPDLLVRIVTVADVFDALTARRPYRPAFSSEVALQYLWEKAGLMFDPALVEAFTTIAGRPS